MLGWIFLFQGRANKIPVKVRGRAISRAVESVELTRRDFMADLKGQKIGIVTDQLATFKEVGSSLNISRIVITLAQ